MQRLQRWLAGGVFLAAAVALGGGGLPSADAGRKTTYTKVTATATKPDADGRQVVTVNLDTEKPWYVYANPPENKVVEGARTLVTVASGTGKVQDVKIEYPPGKIKEDKDVGSYKVYPGKVSIRATLRRAKGDTGPLEVTVQYMNCNGNECLMSQKAKVTVP